MQAPQNKSTRRAALCRLAALFAVAGALAACDKHDAQEVPESYGHGSAHADPADDAKSFTDHHSDSTGKFHFSDTQGTADVPGTEPAVPAATASPAAASSSPAPASTPAGHFF